MYVLKYMYSYICIFICLYLYTHIFTVASLYKLLRRDVVYTCRFNTVKSKMRLLGPHSQCT